ncbi:KDP operon transcriptional regulatory protein KdpE [subsurface metagenome]
MPDDILIIESEPILKKRLISALRKVKFEITAVSNHTDALMKIAKRKPDLVIMDIALTDQDDVKICCQIHSGHSVPVVLLGEDSGDDICVMMKDTIADFYISKPFSCIALVAQIKTILHRYKIVFNSRSQHE